MLSLPTFHALLNPCVVSPAEFTAHEHGRFCGSCRRVVQDFSQSANPVADLAAARAASPDGRVCGSFRAGQVAAPPTLTRRLRWFLLALVLVVAQGLTAREALAQVRRAGHSHPKQPHKQPAEPEYPLMGDITTLPSSSTSPLASATPRVYYAEVMPSFRGNSYVESAAFIRQQVKYPAVALREGIEGRIFISFTVDVAGQLHDVRILKGLHPALDAEVLRAASSLTGFQPGRQNGRPVAVNLTIPVTFKTE